MENRKNIGIKKEWKIGKISKIEQGVQISKNL
jgi:hypothetical protein